MIVACYDPGLVHVGEAVLDLSGERPRCLLARRIPLPDSSDETLTTLTGILAGTWQRFGVARVVFERVPRGTGAISDPGAMAGVMSGLIGTAHVAGILRGVAGVLRLPCVSVAPQTVRARLKLRSKADGVAYVHEHVDGWERDEGIEGSPSGAVYRHRYDAACVGIADAKGPRGDAPKKAPRVRQTPKKHLPNPRQRARTAERNRVGCTCGRMHVKGCALYNRPSTYKKKIDAAS